MKAYADTSFLVKLVTREPGSQEAMAEFRRLGLPRLIFLPLHGLEAANAVRQRAFHLRIGHAEELDRLRIDAGLLQPVGEREIPVLKEKDGLVDARTWEFELDLNL